ncbi:MAG: molybdopterin-dependent oxidoreductase [Bacteroidota bacterium]
MEEIRVDEQGLKKYSRRSWLAFVKFLLLGGAGYVGWKWLGNQPLDGGIQGGVPMPLREGLTANERLFGRIFSPHKRIQEYPKSQAATAVRLNGVVGLDNSQFDYAQWRLQVKKLNGEVLSIPLKELKKLPKTEVVFNFKCIEGWSQVSWWAGVRFADFVKHYGLQKEVQLAYVGLHTPDEAYYVGMDTDSAMHPQTILSYEMNGKPLSLNHGYPLRLIIPVKYGVKHLKRIGTVFFSADKPADYWAERGYDYYTGL